MECDTFQIVPSAAGWVLRLNGRSLETFDTKEEAGRAAAAAARLSRRRGRQVEIITESDEEEAPSRLRQHRA